MLDKKFKYERMPVTNEMTPNSTVHFDGYYLSYNRRSSDYGCDTTAIVVGGRVFLLLNGDHREELLSISNTDGLDGCLNYLINNINLSNKYSEINTLVGVDKDVFGLVDTFLNHSNQDMLNKLTDAFNCGSIKN